MSLARTRPSYALIAIVGFLTVCPVAMLVLGSFSEGLTAFGSFTTDKYVAAYTDPALFGVIVNTIVFVLGSSTLATGLALFLAYLNTRTDSCRIRSGADPGTTALVTYKQPLFVLVIVHTSKLDVLLLERVDFPGHWQSV